MRSLILAGVSSCALLLSVVSEAKAACDDRFINTCSTRSWHWSSDHKHSEFRQGRRHIRTYSRVVGRFHAPARERNARAAVAGALAGGQASVASGGLIRTTKAADTVAVEHSRPRECYGIAWCGCWLRHVLGIPDSSLNLAANWRRVGQPASVETATIAVWPHHVGKVLGHRSDGKILLQSGNDGGAVRTRWVSPNIRGPVTYRRV